MAALRAHQPRRRCPPNNPPGSPPQSQSGLLKIHPPEQPAEPSPQHYRGCAPARPGVSAAPRFGASSRRDLRSATDRRHPLHLVIVTKGSTPKVLVRCAVLLRKWSGHPPLYGNLTQNSGSASPSGLANSSFHATLAVWPAGRQTRIGGQVVSPHTPRYGQDQRPLPAKPARRSNPPGTQDAYTSSLYDSWGLPIVGRSEAGGRRLEAQLLLGGVDRFEEVAWLEDWLRDEPELRGQVRRTIAPVGLTELSGGVGEVLTVVLGSGGVAVVLARSLNTWLRTRRPTVTLTVSVKDRSATLHAHDVEGSQVDETLKILRAVLTDSPEAIDE